nr:MAG TPA: hypothetical protein [Caudoviricetes sp.]
MTRYVTLSIRGGERVNYTAVAITAIICITILVLCHEPKKRK